jgi:MoxR-like ATPase
MKGHYTQDVSDILQTAPKPNSGPDDPSGYLPDQNLVEAVNVALTLGKPLLLTGDPGTGKTQLAHSLAWQLWSRRDSNRLNVGSPILEKFETKSTSTARDLFYTFDAIRCFQASRQTAGFAAADIRVAGDESVNTNAAFITYNALGRALLKALEPPQIPAQVQTDILTDAPPTRSVVLIDEVDKAPRDFPNDLLNEIDEMYFRIPELDNVRVGGKDVIPPNLRPIVVITSNSEKSLPDPFLRRCIYYHIPFPDSDKRLGDILLSRVAQFSATRGPLATDAVTFFQQLRARTAPKAKTSPAELIDWLLFMLASGARMDKRLADARELALAGIGALAKDRDRDSLRKELEAFLDKR